MNFLEERIVKDGIVRPGNVLKVDSFLNHQMDISLMEEIGREFKRRFANKHITKVMTIEASGIGIVAKKGSGKTKRIIDLANTASKDSRHDIVFIDDDNRYMYDLRHEVRFINAGEYAIANDQMFMGLILGVVAQNFDLGLIFIDAFKKLIKADLSSTEWMFDRLAQISEKHNVDFVISVSEDPADLPEFIAKYVV